MPASMPAAAAQAAANVRAADDAFYPSSDGKPMAENMWQADAIMSAAGDLRDARPQALVAADILMYPEEGNNRKSFAPDVLVAFGLGTHKRSSYLVWAEGKPPDWVLEVASPSTRERDLNEKRRAYAAMGVREYWLFDAKGDVYGRRTPPAPRLQGLVLVNGEYRALQARLSDGERMIRSEVLGMDVYADGELLRFRDAATGRDVPHRSELRAAAERERAQAKREAARRKAAEADAERQAAHLEQQAAHLEQQAARAEREAAARKAAEARVAELEAALRKG